MMRTSAIAAIGFLGLTVAASAQVQTPVRSTALIRHAISDSQVQQLSNLFKSRPAAEALTLNSSHLRAVAETQAPPVAVSGSKVVPAPADERAEHAQPSSTAPSVARVEVVPTTSADETLLKRAIASQDSLRPALSVTGSNLITLPGVVRMAAQSGPALQLKPFILVNQPLQQIASGEFEGELLIGVTDLMDTGVTRQLPTPLLFVIAGAVRSDPDQVLVDTTAPPFRRVKVIVDALENQAARLRIISVIDRKGTDVSLPLAGELNVDPESGSIEGFGLEATRVHVGTTAVPTPAGRVVTLRVDPSGYLDQGMLPLNASGMAQTVLRSDGVGTARIKATSPELKAATSSIYFRLPVRTLGAAILGGLLGAFVAYTTGAQVRPRRWTAFAGGALFGVLIFVLYAVGVNVLPVTPKVTVGAAVVFAVSAIAAWLGPNLATWRQRLPS